MPTTILKSLPGIKRDGTEFEGENYIDGQWMRFQRGLPRKIAGYRAVNKYPEEISRGFTTFTQNSFTYCHTGSATLVQRFYMDTAGNSSVLVDRTPIWVAATGTVTLDSGASGSVDGITVNGVQIMSGAVAFNSDLDATASDVAANITAHTSSPNYTATSSGAVITIEAATEGTSVNGFVVVSSATTITTTDANMSGGENGLIESANNTWTFDYQFAPSDSENYIVAAVSQNGAAIDNDEGGQIFFGVTLATDRLQEIALPAGMNATGGVVILHPYLFYYGTDGMIGWSVAGAPTDLNGSGSGQARPWSQKIIKGLPLRGGSGSAPAGVFWAYDAVIRSSFIGGSQVFQFDVIATGTSIMSANAVIDYDGVFYWAGVDRFLFFNGVVRELPNTMNLNWFLDNLRIENRAKVFAFKVPRYGEIWWCYPRGDATECTHAIIYNVRENTWYDTTLPADGRTAGQFANAYAAPVLTGAAANSSGKFNVWIHERGLNAIDGSSQTAILSYFQTSDLNSLVQGQNASLRITAIEPDFVQSGVMEVQVSGKENARAPLVEGVSTTFPATATQPHEQIVVRKDQFRELRVKFTSNTVDGDYQMGQIIAHIDTGDERKLV